MTSLERSADHRYGSFVEPDYNALTYTWGRYRLKNGPKLSVRGITWDVPAIDPAHFTDAHFHSICEKIAGPSGLIWLDIACIDQANDTVKLDEIGRQADIFRRAKQVYVWLSGLNTDSLTRLTEHVGRFARQLEDLEVRGHNYTYDPEEVDHLVTGEIEGASCAVEKLISDPWFSSLWTLQEAYLRDDAILLSKNGDTVYYQTYKSDTLSLHTICGYFQTIKLALYPYVHHSAALQRTMYLLEKSGLVTINIDGGSAMLLYSAAGHRTTSEVRDRVYGIMQVYSLRLGASKNPDQDFTLEQLEDELGAALNEQSPITAQMHVHAKPPPDGKSWRVTQQCILPEVYYLSREINTRCSLSFNNNTLQPSYTGSTCPLPQLCHFWQQASNMRQQLLCHFDPDFVHRWGHYQANIDLDASPNNDGLPPRSLQLGREAQSTCPCASCARKDPSEKHALEQLVRSLLPSLEHYSILLLGRVSLYNLIGANHGTMTSAWAGLIVQPEPQTQRHHDAGASCYRRVGICSWEAAEGDLKPVHEELWKPFGCLIG